MNMVIFLMNKVFNLQHDKIQPWLLNKHVVFDAKEIQIKNEFIKKFYDYACSETSNLSHELQKKIHDTHSFILST